MKDGDILLDAVATLEESGWATGHLEKTNGSMCAIGAVNKVIFGKAAPSIYPWHMRKVSQRKRVVAALANKLDEQAPDRYDDYVSFYDGEWTNSANMNKVMNYNDTRANFDKLKSLFVETAVMLEISPERQRR